MRLHRFYIVALGALLVPPGLQAQVQAVPEQLVVVERFAVGVQPRQVVQPVRTQCGLYLRDERSGSVFQLRVSTETLNNPSLNEYSSVGYYVELGEGEWGLQPDEFLQVNCETHAAIGIVKRLRYERIGESRLFTTPMWPVI